jgi:hypothetical protein
MYRTEECSGSRLSTAVHRRADRVMRRGQDRYEPTLVDKVIGFGPAVGFGTERQYSEQDDDGGC